MDFTIEDKGHEKRVLLSGSFTFADNQKFKEMMAAATEKLVKAIALDFNAVEFIDSGALGMLLLFREECQPRQISLSLNSAQGQVKKIFAIARFDQLFAAAGNP